MPIVRLGDPVNLNAHASALRLDVASDGRVVALQAGQLTALDAGGGVIWRESIGGNTGIGAMEVLADGRILLSGAEHYGFNRGNIYQIRNADGSATTGVQSLSTFASTVADANTLALSDGGFFVTYRDFDNGGNTLTSSGTFPNLTVDRAWDVMWRTVSPTGEGGPESIIWNGLETNTHATTPASSFNEEAHDAVQLSGGAIAVAYLDQVVWGTYQQGGAPLAHTNPYMVRVQIGSPEAGFSAPITVNTDAVDIVHNGILHDAPHPIQQGSMNSIIALPDGGFAVIWHERQFEQTLDPADPWIDHGYVSKIRYFDASGTALTDEISILARDETYHFSLQIHAEALADGRIVMGYTTGGSNSATAFLSVLDPDGLVSETIQVSPSGASGQNFQVHDLAVDGEGVAHLAYSDSALPGAHVVVQSFGLSGFDYNAVSGGDSSQTLNGGGGADFLSGDGGNDVLYGRAGDDRLWGGDDDDWLNGGGGHDALSGGAGQDTLLGGDGDDHLDGGAGADVLTGGLGDDSYLVDNAADLVTEAAGQGIDTVRVTIGNYVLGDHLENLTIVGTQSFIDATGNGVANVMIGNGGNNRLYGLEGDDVLKGAGGADWLHGGAGSDQLSGGEGLDWLLGEDGDDVLSGGADEDQLQGGSGDDTLAGGAGDDRLSGGTGADALNGDTGTDTASYSGSSAGVHVDLAAASGSGGDAQGDTLLSIENLTGSDHADTLTGDAGVNVLDGGAGDDTLTGGAGADTLIGGQGIDTARYSDATSGVNVFLNTGTGGAWAAGDTYSSIENVIGSNHADLLVGNGANNMLHGGGGADEVKGGAGDDQLLGAAGDDVLEGGDGNDNLAGGDNRDTLQGDAGDDVLNGGAGVDKLFAGAGADHLIGGADNDKLNGGSDNDILDGGQGNDILTGGSGDDLFVFRGASGSDTITDFRAGAGLRDVISFSTSLFVNLADVKAHTTNDGLGNCVISKNGVVITLAGVTINQLVADDFEFVAAAPVLDLPGKGGDALTIPFELDPFDPLILPTGLDTKATFEEAPLVLPGSDAFVAEAPDQALGARPAFSREDIDIRDYAWVV